MAYGMITGSIGVVGQNPALNSTPQAGGTAVSNLSMVGGIITGSSRQFVSLPVAGQANVLGLPTNALGTAGNYALSSSFAGVSGSIIQSLNYLKALQDNDSGGDVTGPGSSTDNALVKFDGTGGKTLLNTGVILSDSDGLSAISAISIDDAGTIGPASVSDLITLSADGDLTFKDGAYDLNVASHDGTNGLALGGVIVSATAAELNYNDITTLGTAQASKALTIAADDTWTVAGMTAANLGTVTTVEINGGSLDNATVGASTQSTGRFTSLSSSLTLNVVGSINTANAIAASGTISGNSVGVSSGLANILSNGAVSGVTLSASSDISANGFKMDGTDASGVPRTYRLSVVGGILLVDEFGI
jgi:hypothetical protein